MKKNLISTIALVLTACIMVLCLGACGSGTEPETTITDLEAENARLREQLAIMESRLEELEEGIGFKSWKMKAVAWSESNGASVTFTAEPRSYQQDLEVFFNIRLNGEEVDNLACAWNGTAYEAVAELEAADGYSYTCITVMPDGSREQIILSSPDNPIYDTLVNMRNSLTAYCNLYVSDWEVKDGKLDITSGYVQVQLPQITPDGGAPEYKGSQLVLELNGNVIESQTLELPKGEGLGSYETALTSISFNMPEMDDDYQLDLSLNVNLSNGEVITINGGSWLQTGGVLTMSVG